MEEHLAPDGDVRFSTTSLRYVARTPSRARAVPWWEYQPGQLRPPSRSRPSTSSGVSHSARRAFSTPNPGDPAKEKVRSTNAQEALVAGTRREIVAT